MGQDQSSQLRDREEILGKDGAETGFLRTKGKHRKHRYFVSSGNLEGVENIEAVLHKSDLSPMSDDGKNECLLCVH